MNEEQKAEWGRRLKALQGEHLQKAQTDAFLTELIVNALDAHAKALKNAATASDRYSKWIAFATGALVLATLALVWATLKIGG